MKLKIANRNKIMFIVCLSTYLFLFIASLLSFSIYQIDVRSTTGLSQNAISATLNKGIALNAIEGMQFNDLIITAPTIDNELVHKIIYIKSHGNDYYKQMTTIIKSANHFPIVLLGKNVFQRYEDEGMFHFQGIDFKNIYQIESDIASYNNNCFIIEEQVQNTHKRIIIDGAKVDVRRAISMLQINNLEPIYQVSFWEIASYRTKIIVSV